MCVGGGGVGVGGVCVGGVAHTAQRSQGPELRTARGKSKGARGRCGVDNQSFVHEPSDGIFSGL